MKKAAVSAIQNRSNNPFEMTKDLIYQFSPNQKGLDRRLLAFNHYLQIPMPSKKERLWRKTPIEDLPAHSYRLGDLKKRNGLSDSNRSILEEKEISINTNKGNVESFLPDDLKNKGLIVCGIQEAEKDYPVLIKSIAGKIVPSSDGKFSALVQALDLDGLLIHIPQFLHVEKVIHPVITSTLLNLLDTRHIMISLEEGSSASILLDWKGLKGKNDHLLASVVEIRLGKNARLDLCELQTWPKEQWAILHERTELLENSQLNWSIYADGGKYARSFLDVKLSGENAHAKITGTCVNIRPGQLDFDTFQHHAALATSSDLLFNMAAANDSRMVWTGMIRVEKDGLKADGFQANRNLVLCGDPHLESIPGLEILADDVRCSHGVSMGEIDSDQLFYLLSRGVGEKEAKEMIARGFLDAGLNRVVNLPFRRKIRERIQTRMTELFCG